MYIIVIGGGKIGFYLSKALLNEGHEVLIIEKNLAKCERINEELGSVCIRGDGCETSVLAEAGSARANLFVAVTDEDEDNLVACQVAKHKFNVPRTVARINNPKNEALFKKLGIDCIVSTVNLVLEHIEEEVPTHSLIHLFTFGGKGLEIVEVKIPANSAAVGKSIKELSLPENSVLSLIIRRDLKPQLPTPDIVLEAEDRIIALTTSEDEDALRIALAGS